MHQQPLLAPDLPNRSSSAGHRSGVSGRIVNLMPPFLFGMPRSHSLSTRDLAERRKFPVATDWVTHCLPLIPVTMSHADAELERRLWGSEFPDCRRTAGNGAI